jgi:hypothetical protein
MKIGKFEIDTDTIQVVVFVGLATGAIVTFTGIGMLANNWNKQSNADRTVIDYGHALHEASHGDHGAEHGDDHAEPAAH